MKLTKTKYCFSKILRNLLFSLVLDAGSFYILCNSYVTTVCLLVLFSKANDVLNRLLYSSTSDFSVSESFDSSSFTTPSASDKMNLRVRCKGKVHKYEVNKASYRLKLVFDHDAWCILVINILQFDPLSKVITLLGEELSVDGDNKVLLSHKTATIAPTDSPGSLGLTTADIIGEQLMHAIASSPALVSYLQTQLSWQNLLLSQLSTTANPVMAATSPSKSRHLINTWCTVLLR